MNYFAFESAAERYARGRPFFHPLVIEHVKKLLSLRLPVARGLDVGCGTGLSAVALKHLARKVVGIDAAPAMLARAPRDARIRYLAATAEQLPFGNDRFDLMTLSQVCHWLDRERFFSEARRVLRPAAWLIIYDAYFSSEMIANPEFQAWYRTEFRARYPTPPRARLTFKGEDATTAPFGLRGEDHLQHAFTFTARRLVDYLLTQSNVIAMVECGAEDIRAVRRWLEKSVEPFFAESNEADFVFNLAVWRLQSKKRLTKRRPKGV
jgi:ubiquinone/menaquinone biosynthesis C-methylase UbiE